MYADAGFITFRNWFKDDLDAMFLRVAKHVELGMYKLVSVSASKHSFVVVCISDKQIVDFPDGSWAGWLVLLYAISQYYDEPLISHWKTVGNQYHWLLIAASIARTRYMHMASTKDIIGFWYLISSFSFMLQNQN